MCVGGGVKIVSQAGLCQWVIEDGEPDGVVWGSEDCEPAEVVWGSEDGEPAEVVWGSEDGEPGGVVWQWRIPPNGNNITWKFDVGLY